MPKEVSVEGNRLIFTRPLNKTDEGVYECEARNSVGSVKAEVNVQIPGKAYDIWDLCNMALRFNIGSISENCLFLNNLVMAKCIFSTIWIIMHCGTSLDIHTLVTKSQNPLSSV